MGVYAPAPTNDDGATSSSPSRPRRHLVGATFSRPIRTPVKGKRQWDHLPFFWPIRDDGLRGGIFREASMGTDSRKDGDKDRRTPVHNDGSDTLRRIEVITGTGRRRRWDAETKARLVAESFEPGRGVSEVARCHDISPSLLFLWRRQAAKATKNAESKVRGGPAFVPMVVTGDAPVAPVANEACGIEVELGDVRIRIKGPVDRSVLREVFLAARTTR